MLLNNVESDMKTRLEEEGNHTEGARLANRCVPSLCEPDYPRQGAAGQ